MFIKLHCIQNETDDYFNYYFQENYEFSIDNTAFQSEKKCRHLLTYSEEIVGDAKQAKTNTPSYYIAL